MEKISLRPNIVKKIKLLNIAAVYFMIPGG
jgi:hypothetical protein